MIYIDYKNETVLIKRLLENEKIEKLHEKTFLNKLMAKKTQESDVYFHYGLFDKMSMQKIHAAKRIIVSSFAIKKDLLKLAKNIDEKTIEVIYPSINEKVLNKEECKRILCEEYNFSLDTKIILFTAKNFKKNGARDFLDICGSLSQTKLQIIVSGSKDEITALKFLIRKNKNFQAVLFLQEYKNMALLFTAADIFLLPTSLKVFSRNVLKAMYHHCAVFVCKVSSTCEILDVFSSLSDGKDGATTFKIEALLNNEAELASIQNTNHEQAKDFLEEKVLIKTQELLFL